MNSLRKQRTLAMMTGFERYTKKTRRALFLEQMEQVVPWGKLCALIEPHYPKPGDGRQCLRCGHVAGPAAWRRNAGVGRRSVSGPNRRDPRVRATSTGFHPAALSLQGPDRG